MNNLAMELTRAAATVAALGGSSAEFGGLSDVEVLAALLRLSNTAAALLAGTIAEGPGRSWVSPGWRPGTGLATRR
ncbi:hypothetical protein E3O06_09900 [Cryobacterium glaciale]|uniref:DUF222 domain-containing protein n=1 Tax=Cryobacterium glaciale TaxID=1259145 RepID=A0A4R8UXH8_9MICO|nr:hypothetical protein [Cryobacterium glaciale]TFB72624.1 hypothetical protein E3O06_09900 [Cryobacterium glaciale]